jgi:glycosyltransferase involved in cell wall biosynthesis
MTRIAMVHEWLVHYAGSERVLEQLLHSFPEADLFALVDFLPESQRGFVRGRKIRTSFLQHAPLVRSHYRKYLPLMPLAVEQFDVSGYELVISSNHAVAKGIITGPDQVHVSYVHSPMRYAWDLQHQYLRQSGLDRGLRSWLARWTLHKMRIWDARTANGVDRFVANSEYIARRIRKVYRRDAAVVYPPVDTNYFVPGDGKDEYYLAAGRLVPYKRMDLIVQAFSTMGSRRLIVAGDGPDMERVRRQAGRNVEFVGYCPRDRLRSLMQGALALVYGAEEDFGILPVEAMACGTPVIAFGRGGVTETVVPVGSAEPTGVFFDEQSVEAVRRAVDRFEAQVQSISPQVCRQRAQRYSIGAFREAFQAEVDQALAERGGGA